MFSGLVALQTVPLPPRPRRSWSVHGPTVCRCDSLTEDSPRRVAAPRRSIGDSIPGSRLARLVNWRSVARQHGFDDPVSQGTKPDSSSGGAPSEATRRPCRVLPADVDLCWVPRNECTEVWVCTVTRLMRGCGSDTTLTRQCGKSNVRTIAQRLLCDLHAARGTLERCQLHASLLPLKE